MSALSVVSRYARDNQPLLRDHRAVRQRGQRALACAPFLRSPFPKSCAM